MKSNFDHLPEAEYWWQVMPALPFDKDSQEYHALRRVWGDHTINTSKKGRGYYWFGTEDNLTPALFQNWAISDDPERMRSLLELCGATVSRIRSVRWAYSCEEELASGRPEGIKGRFVIPDIILHVEDEHGSLVVAFEVKKPGVVPSEKDLAKLSCYRDLPRLRSVQRRHAAFIVGHESASPTREAFGGMPALTWHDLMELQVETVAGMPKVVADWIRRSYSRYGIGSAPAPTPFAGPDGSYATKVSYERIDAARFSKRVAAFLKGSEVVEAFCARQPSTPPFEWLSADKSRAELSSLKTQTTADRRVPRWSRDWSIEQEAAQP